MRTWSLASVAERGLAACEAFEVLCEYAGAVNAMPAAMSAAASRCNFMVVNLQGNGEDVRGALREPSCRLAGASFPDQKE
jgi:hypothetical protein